MKAVFAMLLASAGVWLDVPFVKQEKNGCGAAAVAMVMEYWMRQDRGLQANADPASIQRKLYSPDAGGIYGRVMERYLEEQHFRAFAFVGEWEDLREHLSKGRPLIVCLGGKPRHYVVVAGLDDATVSVNDPADRKLRKMDRASFEKQWSAARNWTLLAVPRQGS